jgi:hypothetical protein
MRRRRTWAFLRDLKTALPSSKEPEINQFPASKNLSSKKRHGVTLQ